MLTTIGGLVVSLVLAPAPVRPKGMDSFTLASPVLEFQNPRFGEALAADGPVLFVGAPGDDTNGTDAGAVYVYRREGSVLVFLERIDPPVGYSATGFGAALAVQDGTLVVGSDGDIVAKGGLPAIRAAIFARLAQGWRFKQPIESLTRTPNDGFGRAVAITGDVIAVGADRDSEGGAERGAVHVFRPAPDRTLQLIAKLRPGPQGKGAAPTRFGKSLSAFKGRLAVGAPGPAANSSVIGAIHLFDAIRENLTSNVLSSSNATPGDEFGRSVSLSEGHLLIGAPGEQSSAGAAYVYDVQNIGSEIQIRPGGLAPNDQFGAAVSLFRNQIVIGAPGTTAAAKGASAAGLAYNFEISGDEVQPGSITGSDPGTGVFSGAGSNEFGAATAASDDLTAISAPDGAGTVDVFFNAEKVFSEDFEGIKLPLATQTTAGILSACPPGSEHEQVFIFDDMESGAPGWSHTGSNDTWSLTSARARSGVFSWQADALPVVGDQILVSPPYMRTTSALAGAKRRLVLSFYQFRDLQSTGAGCADGGLAESRREGLDPSQLTEVLADPYDGTITTASNPLQGAPAWCGDQSWTRTVIEVERGIDGANLTVLANFNYRLRLGSDQAVGTDAGFEGWYIDDFLLETCVDE